MVQRKKTHLESHPTSPTMLTNDGPRPTSPTSDGQSPTSPTRRGTGFNFEKYYFEQLAKFQKNNRVLKKRVKSMKSKKGATNSPEVFAALKGFFSKIKTTAEAIKLIVPEFTEEEIEEKFLGHRFSDNVQQKTMNIERIHRYISNTEAFTDQERAERILTIQLENLKSKSGKAEWYTAKLKQPKPGRFTGTETDKSRLEKTTNILNFLLRKLDTPFFTMVGKSMVMSDYAVIGLHIFPRQRKPMSSFTTYLAFKLERPFVYYHFELKQKNSELLKAVLDILFMDFADALGYEDYELVNLKATGLDLVAGTSTKVSTPVDLERFEEDFEKKKKDCGWDHLSMTQIEDHKTKEYISEMFCQGEKATTVKSFTFTSKNEDGKVMAKFTLVGDLPYDVALKDLYKNGFIGDPLFYISACRSNENNVEDQI